MPNALPLIADREWEVFIIGGGINGCAIARDSVLRGFKTALVERNDFASQTSSRTTKLIHGGIRYLEQMEFGLVYECLHERTILMTIAPHLVRPLPFLIPVMKSDRYPLPFVQFGTWLYAMLAGRDQIKPKENFSSKNLLSRYPFLDKSKLKGAVRYFDAQMDDIRLCLETALSAQMEGAAIANHVEVTRIGIRKDGKFDITMEDTLTRDQAKARAVKIINAAGPWADRMLSILEPRHKPLLHLSKGVHLITKKKISDDAILLLSSDNRVIFIIPWHDKSLIGTTDTEFRGLPEDAVATEDDISFLLDEVKRIGPDLNISRRDIVTTFAGVRPIAVGSAKNTAKLSRRHVIRELPPGFFSIAGGKYTTHRLLAQEVCDLLEKSLKKSKRLCKTAEMPLLGSFDLPYEEANFHIPNDISGLNRNTLEHLIQIYGRQIRHVVAVANRSQNLQKPFCAHHAIIGAQVIYAIEHELAQTLADVCVRRLRLDQTACRGLDCVRKVADLMSDRLRWSPAKKETEVAHYLDWVKLNTQFVV